MRHLIKFGYIYNGLAVVLISLSLLFDRSYFFYPPEWVAIENNPTADIIGIIAGSCLMYYGICNKHNNFWSGIFLGVCAGFFSWLIGIEGFHGFGLSYDKFNIPMILETMHIGFLMIIAYLRNSKNKTKEN